MSKYNHRFIDRNKEQASRVAAHNAGFTDGGIIIKANANDVPVDVERPFVNVLDEASNIPIRAIAIDLDGTCSSCVYAGNKVVPRLRCRRYPPSITGDYPIVRADGWCGECRRIA